MNRNTPLLFLILVLAIVFLLLFMFAVRLGGKAGTPDSTVSLSRRPADTAADSTGPNRTDPIPTEMETKPEPAEPIPTETETEPAPTDTESVPVQTDPPPSTEPGREYIGTLYTREELEAPDSTLQGYGAGSNVDAKNRPTGAMSIDSKYKKYNATFIGPDDGNVYFTFNCSYEYKNLTSDILDILKEKDVKCVFFVNMYFAKSNPELIQRIIDEGHTLGNHCTNHPDLPDLPLDEMVTEIMTIHNYVLETYGYQMTLFRPPSGYYSEQMLALVQSLGYQTVNFSFSYVDWEPEDPMDADTAREKLISRLHSGAIYQLHTVFPTNAAILSDVIDAAREKGLTPALFS